MPSGLEWPIKIAIRDVEDADKDAGGEQGENQWNCRGEIRGEGEYNHAFIKSSIRGTQPRHFGKYGGTSSGSLAVTHRTPGEGDEEEVGMNSGDDWENG